VTTIQAHPVQRRHRGRRRVQGRHARARGERLPVADALKAAVSDRTASLMVGNPDDMGSTTPRSTVGRGRPRRRRALLLRPRELQRRDGKLKARDLGFDACMYMLHKTFGAPKAAAGRRRRLRLHRRAGAVPPGPSSSRTATATGSTATGRRASARCASSSGNVPQLVYAYTWSRAMGAEGITRPRRLRAR
jgi:glycine dehydrogenase subunit 2